MVRHFAAAACVIAIGCLACGGSESVKPVATPNVSLSVSDAPAGSWIDMTYRFAVAADAPAFGEDYLVFVHFLDEDHELMWTDDHPPATPTREWRPGATIQYSRPMLVPRFPYTGPATIEIGLYSPGSGQRLPLGGEDAGMHSYRVAGFTMSPEAKNLAAAYGEGWYDAEGGAGGSEWRWSRREGALTLKNPRKDAVVMLQVDQPVTGLPRPQHVDIRLDDRSIDSFDLAAGAPQLRRIPVTADQFGPAETVRVTIAVDPPFVPAAIPALRSTDYRELGIRVFRAYVQPK